MAQSPPSGWHMAPFKANRISPRPYEDAPSGGTLPSSSLRIPMDEPASSRMVSRAVSYVEVEVQATNPSISYLRKLSLFFALSLIVSVRVLDAVESMSRVQTDFDVILIKVSLSVQAALFAVSALLFAISRQVDHPHMLRFQLSCVGTAIIAILVSSQIEGNQSTRKWPLFSILTVFGLVSTSMKIRFRHCMIVTSLTDLAYIILLFLRDNLWEEFANAIVLIVLSFFFCQSSFQNEVFRRAEVSYIKRIQKENRQLQEKLKKDAVAINTPLDRIMSKLNLARDACDGELALELEEVIMLLSAHAEALLQPALPAAADFSAVKYLEFASGPASKANRKLTTKISSVNFLAVPVVDRSERENFRLDISLSEWNVDYLYIDANTEGRAILMLAEAIFVRHNLFSDLKIESSTFCSFFKQLQRRYHPKVPYHNSSHGADVCHSFYYVISCGDRIKFLQPVEIMAAVIACLGHDVAHPGYNNAFMINSRSPEAMLYNDRTVLENMHVAEIFRVASSEQSNIFGSLSKDQYKTARSIIIEMILATDLARHFEILSAFKAKLSSTNTEKKWLESDVVTTLQIVIKIADLGHFAKEREIHLRWNDLVLEEFYRQGDEEIARGLEVSPLMDRRLRQTMLSQNQVGFINYIVRPLFSAGLEIFPAMQPIVAHMEANFEYWKAYKHEDRMVVPNEQSESASFTDQSASTREVP